MAAVAGLELLFSSFGSFYDVPLIRHHVLHTRSPYLPKYRYVESYESSVGIRSCQIRFDCYHAWLESYPLHGYPISSPTSQSGFFDPFLATLHRDLLMPDFPNVSFDSFDALPLFPRLLLLLLHSTLLLHSPLQILHHDPLPPHFLWRCT